MAAFNQGSRAVVKRPSLHDLGTIPVQCHVALRGTGGVFAHPSGREGGPANQHQDNTRPIQMVSPSNSCGGPRAQPRPVNLDAVASATRDATPRVAIPESTRPAPPRSRKEEFGGRVAFLAELKSMPDLYQQALDALCLEVFGKPRSAGQADTGSSSTQAKHGVQGKPKIKVLNTKRPCRGISKRLEPLALVLSDWSMVCTKLTLTNATGDDGRTVKVFNQVPEPG